MTTTVDDVNTATLSKILGLQVIPFRKNPHRVSFRIEGDFELVLKALLENRPIPIQSFLTELRGMRSNLFMLKNTNGDGDDNGKKNST